MSLGDELAAVTAVLMCAGRSSRSRAAHTLAIPKCMLHIGQSRFLGSLIDWLCRNGITKIIVVAYTHAEEICRYLAGRDKFDNKLCDIEIVVLDELRDTNWTALHGLRNVRTDRALVLTADTVWKIELIKLFRLDRAVDVWIPVVTPRGPCANGFMVDHADRITGIGSLPDLQPDATVINMGVGVYMINSVAKVLEGLHRTGDLDTTAFDPDILRLGAYRGVGTFIDFGSDEELLKLRRTMQDWPEFFK